MSPHRASAALTVDWRHFEVAVDHGVLTITLNRPDKLNALTFDVYADLRDLFFEAPHHPDVRCIVLAGEGRGFCSGGDVEEIIGQLLGFDTRQLLDFTRMTGSVIQQMRETSIPIVAAVNGTAAGAGAVLALAADFRLVAPSATFQFLFTKVGLSGGDMGAAHLLPRLVGLGRATEILMFGEPVDADEAVRIGLASRVVQGDQLGADARDLARRLADGPNLAYQATKLLLAREQDMSLAAAIELEAMTQALLMNSKDHAEFHAAFTGHRPPQWTGR
jgi:enoyl-CoA hydratase/carnithine racemase